MKVPYLAVGNDELGDHLDDEYDCPRCNMKHRIEHPPTTDGDIGLLQIVRCGDKSYVVGINNRSICK